MLGIVFTFFYSWAFRLLGISDQLPKFGGFLSLIGAFLFVIGIAYWLIYRGDLYKNIDLVTVGTLYKLAYCAIAYTYFAIEPIPHIIFVALFGIIDLVMFFFMLECLLYLKTNPN